jgi:hypothetical protein
MALATNVNEREAAAASAPLTATAAAAAARQRAPHRSILARCRQLEENLQRNREWMEEHHEFALRFKAMKGSSNDEELSQQIQETSSSGQASFRNRSDSSMEAERENRDQLLFGAPSGPGGALASYRGPGFSPRQPAGQQILGQQRLTPRQTPRSRRSDVSSGRACLQQAGNMIGIGGMTGGDSMDIGSAPGSARGMIKGSFQLRLQAMELNAQRNAEQLDTQRSFLDEIIAIRQSSKDVAATEDAAGAE